MRAREKKARNFIKSLHEVSKYGDHPGRSSKDRQHGATADQVKVKT